MPQFDGSPKEPFFKTQQSSRGITDIVEPQLISIPAFFRLTGLNQDDLGRFVATGQLRLKTIDETTLVDLKSPIAERMLK